MATLYIADSNNSVIRKVTAATGAITTIAGKGTSRYTGDGAFNPAILLDALHRNIALDFSKAI